MRKILEISISSIISFIAFTVLTMKIETPFDGHDTYGFPLTFHIKYSEMCAPCPENPSSTDYAKLLADLGFALLIGIALWKVIDIARVKIYKPKT